MPTPLNGARRGFVFGRVVDRGIVDGVMEAARLLALLGLAHDEVTDVDDVAQLADLAGGFRRLEKALGLFVKDVEAVPCAVEAQVGAHDSDVGAHDLVHLADALGYEHHLFGVARPLVVPVGHVGTELVVGRVFNRVAGGRVGVDYRLNQRVGGQAVAAVEPGAGTFADGVEALDRGFGVGVDLDSAAEVVGGGSHGNRFAGYVDAEAEAVGVDVGEVAARLLRVLVGDVEEDVVLSPLLHLGVDGAGHDVAGRQLHALRVVALHEALPGEVAQDASVASHGLCN